MKLSVKIAITFILLSFGSISVISAVFFNQGKKIIEQNTVRYLGNTNSLKRDALDHWLMERKNLIESIARMPILCRNHDGAQNYDHFRKNIRKYKKEIRNKLMPFIKTAQFKELFLVDANTGMVLVSTDPVQEGKYKDDQKFFIHRSKGTFVQNIIFDVAAQMPVMIFSTQIPDPGSCEFSFLAGKADLTSLSGIFEKRNPVVKTEDTYLVNKFNYYVTEPRFGENYALKKSISTKPVDACRETGKYVGIHQDYRGTRVIGESLWMADRQLVLITEIDLSEAFSLIERLKKQVLLITTLISLAAALLGWLLSITITRPIVALKDATAKIGGGDLDIHLDAPRSGEIKDLANAFQHMAKSLKNTMVRKEKLEEEVAVRRMIQDQLKQSVASLKQSNEDLQQFAYVASHDLQEPLRMVSSFTQLLADRYQDQLDEQAHRWIHFAVDGAERMQRLIQDLLSFSRVHTHGREFEQIRISDVVEEAMQNLQARIEETGTRITVSEMPEIQADHTQMVQLFQNLISNSIKFCRDGIPEIDITAVKIETGWQFCLKDNGIGIDPEFKDKIFVIFQRLHGRQEYPGTGIGLAVCKRIIQRHQGRIWVESAAGKGSQFYFILPDQKGDAP